MPGRTWAPDWQGMWWRLRWYVRSPPREVWEVLATLAPSAWVVAGQVGATSEPWLWRQIVGFRRVRPTVVTERLVNTEEYPLTGIPVILTEAVQYRDAGAGRWTRRLSRAPRGNYYSLSLREQRRLEVAAAEALPSAILCHFGQMSLRFLPVAHRLGVPLVAHYHGLDLSSSLNNRWYRWSLERYVGRFAAHVVVGSHQAELLQAWNVPVDLIHVIPCGVPIDDFMPADRPQEPRPLRVAAVTRLVPQKGVDVSLRAFAIASHRVSDAVFDVVGEGPERRHLESLSIELGIGDRVVFHGPLGQTEVREVLARSDVFVQHSIQWRGSVEGFGVSVTEAAASAVPAVVSDCGGLRDQVVDGVNGIVVAEGDVEATADALVDLLTDPARRRQYGQAGRQRAAEHFDTRVQVARLEDVLLASIEGRSP